MAKQIKYTANVNKVGVIEPDSEWGEISEHIGEKFKDKEIEIVFRKKEKNSTARQRRYYWGVIIPTISIETGQPEIEIHAFNKAKWLPKFDKKSTEDLTTSEREKYHRDIRVWWNREYQIYIPLPGEDGVTYFKS